MGQAKIRAAEIEQLKQFSENPEAFREFVRLAQSSGWVTGDMPEDKAIEIAHKWVMYYHENPILPALLLEQVKEQVWNDYLDSVATALFAVLEAWVDALKQAKENLA